MSPQYDASGQRWAPLDADAARKLLDDTVARAWLSGGVAIDLWLGYTSREHGDIDVSVLRADWQSFIRTLPSWMQLYAAEAGHLRTMDHEEAVPPTNVWCEDRRIGQMVLQINIEDGTNSEWVYRRDPRITKRWSLAVTYVAGLPVIAPELQLLWKSKSPTPRDEADWSAVEPRLGCEAREWLTRAITAAHPQSPWATRTLSR